MDKFLRTRVLDPPSFVDSMKKPLVRFLISAFVLGLAASVPALRAQNAANSDTNSSNTATGTSTTDVVTLSPFDVTGDEAHGYVASESITGTRIASKLQDLPFAVNVVTSEFMNDFAAFDLPQQAAFVSGFSPSEVLGNFQLRGFPANVTLVDGFRRLGLVDTVDIDRMEFIKGAAASIYGATQPGGAVNYITRQPTTRPSDQISVSAGGDGFLRATVFSSGPLGSSHELFYRIDAAEQKNNYAEEFASKHSSYISGKLMWRPTPTTTVRADFEHSETYQHPFAQTLTVTEKQTMPWAGNNITESQYYGMTTANLPDYNYAGPESYSHTRLTSGTMNLEQRVTDFWSLKFGANIFVNPYNDQLVGSGAYYPYGTGNVTVVNGAVTQPFTPEVKDQPQVDWRPQRGGGAQLDNLFTFNTGPINHKLLVTGDYYELSQRNLTLAPVIGTSQATDYYALYSPYTPAGAPYYVQQTTWSPALGYGWNTTLYGQNPGLYNGAVTDSWLAFSDYGTFASERATMFNDKLILLLGGRWDYVKNQVKNYNIPGAAGGSYVLGGTEPTNYQAFDYNKGSWTYQMGLSYKILPQLNAYANKSSAFNPQPQISTNTGNALPNNTSQGYEFGFKGSFLQSRLNFTVDYFLINEYNLAQSETDPVTGIKDTFLAGQEQSKGYEVDANYQITNNLFLQAAWGYTQAKYINAAPLTFLNDLPIRRVPRDNIGVALRYQFTEGRMKGVFAVAGFNYYTKSLVNLGSGKSLTPGPASATSGSAGSVYYVAATNLTYLTDPKITGETKVTTTPVNNVPFPGNGSLPYPSQAANSTVNYLADANGNPLPLANSSVPGVYAGEPASVYVDDGRQNNFNAPYSLVSLGLGYHWKWDRYNNTLQVNIQNVLNRAYTYGSGAAGTPFQVIATYTIGF